MKRIALFCCALTATILLSSSQSQASPYASALNYYASSNAVTFILNEGPITYPTTGSTANPITNAIGILVTYEDGTTNDVYNGVATTTSIVSRGKHSFYMTNSAAPGVNHTGYAIAVTKNNNGRASQLSLDTAANAGSATNFSYFYSPRGVGVNHNPKIGSLFGRVYVANDAASSASGYPTKGLYILNPDFSCVASNTAVQTIFTGSSGPWKVRVAPDNSVVVNDWSGNGAMWLFSPDLTSSNQIFSPALNVNIHGDMFGTPQVFGSLATSNLVVWIADSGMAVPSQAAAPSIVLGQGTERGMYNDVYRYDIGAGPLPWTNAPNYAFNLGLDSISELIVESDVAPDGKIFTGFGRGNLSNPTVNVLDPSGLGVPIWNSWLVSGGTSDAFRGEVMGSTVQYPYAGIRVSPDDQYFVSSGYQNSLIAAKLTNGIPDLSTVFAITNSSSANTGRGGVDWDLADNVYQITGNTVELRSWTLGITTTCITSNDITGTNGTFVVIKPPTAAAATATVPTASQGYGSPKVPVDGVITISLTTNILTAPTVVAFGRSGSAAYLTNYTINLGTNGDGVIISSNSVTFPAATWPHAGNWSVDVHLTPTATPASGPALLATFVLAGGANYVVGGSTAIASVVIANTGPQLLLLSPVGTAFSRNVPGDYVTFKITRWGDVSVPDYTITNINYIGTAVYGTDYTAGAQNFSGSLLNDGSSGITIHAGDVNVTNAIGNPVQRANINVAPSNLTITLTLTNFDGSTNVTAANGYVYVVSATNSVTLTEYDNALGGDGNGGGVALWSDTLNSADTSTNWTLTFASEQFPGVPSTFSYTTNYMYVTNGVIITTNITSITTNVTAYASSLPVVIPGYTNGIDTTNDFDVEFGYSLPIDIPPSPAMLANGWTNVLRMTVNKNSGFPAAVNMYPTGKQFYGNYALKFSMYLSLWTSAIGSAGPFGNFGGHIPIENAISGINHYGTNCNWRPTSPVVPSVSKSGVINSDGIWLTLGAADGVATPADFDAFMPPALPNPGMNGTASVTTSDLADDPGSAHRNDFKNPPFTQTENVLGGEPVGKWVDVSIEITSQTNLVFKVDGFPVTTAFYAGHGSGHTHWLASNNVPNTPYISGNIMIGYQDPDATIGDADSQFVYYSNVRAVELSPYIIDQPAGVIVTNGSSATFLASAMYATAPLNGTWYQAASATAPTAAVQTDVGTTNLTTTLTVTNLQSGTNYAVIFSDAAGSVTSAVAQVEVVVGPTNLTANAGDTVQLSVTANGPAAPTGYQWFTNGVPLINSVRYAGATTATLTITNVASSDAVTYTVGVTNASGVVLPSATLTVVGTLPSPTLSGVSLVGTNAVLTFTSPNGSDNTSSYMLQSSVLVQGPYINTAGTFTGSTGSFQVVVPLTTNTTMFYRLLHN
ncbi:MAG TPA: immunoglobulin domain-containing protein [Verrucomicrobiae bacterium]